MSAFRKILTSHESITSRCLFAPWVMCCVITGLKRKEPNQKEPTDEVSEEPSSRWVFVTFLHSVHGGNAFCPKILFKSNEVREEGHCYFASEPTAEAVTELKWCKCKNSVSVSWQEATGLCRLEDASCVKLKTCRIKKQITVVSSLLKGKKEARSNCEIQQISQVREAFYPPRKRQDQPQGNRDGK